MNRTLLVWARRLSVRVALLPFCLLFELRANANPTGGAVASGSATFSSSGSTFNVNQTSGSAFINWQTFNVNQGETVNFNQPSSSSVTWNYIGDNSASTINGDINAIGYVVLQNPNGFTVGGSAAITAHGLVMTTASTPNLNLSGGGPWSFDAPPPTAKIINYGQINITGGGAAYLIASDIVNENGGSINAPNGHIGLYAGEKVLVSTSPNGEGLSAQVTLPQGSVDNEGRLTANGGNVIAQAQFVNQNGIVQADTAENVNGTIELLGGSDVALGANSAISAQGGAQGVSSGGSVTIQAGNSYSDQPGSTINVAGGAQGGNGGHVDICAHQTGTINTLIDGHALEGFTGGTFTLDPADIWLASADTDPTAPAGYSIVNVNNYNGLSQINIQASDDIVLNAIWQLANQTTLATLSLNAGNDIILNSGSGISAGQNWNVNLTAGTAYSGSTAPAHNSDGIYLKGGATLQTENGNINLWAANEVQVGWSGAYTGVGVANSGTGGISTQGGGSISVTTEFGDVNSGSSPNGYYQYIATAPYDIVSPTLGGISTANGGNVTINAGGNVVSFPATTVAAGDPGSGAFGAAPGNVTIDAGGSVFGNFIVANGMGVINAGQDIGNSSLNVALSLVDGSWDLNAGWDPITQTVQSGVGDIYLQEARNPNGVYNNSTVTVGRKQQPSPAANLFNYGLNDSLSLNAGNSVNLTGYDIPRPQGAVQMILPPILIINAGPGGVVLDQPNAISASSPTDTKLSLYDNDITLFPSPYGELEINTTDGGDLTSGSANTPYLLMSDSGLDQWSAPVGSGILAFGPQDHASVPLGLGNEDPVLINISGNMENVTLQVDKLAQIYVAGDMTGCSFYGENLNPGDVTSITVGGQIYYATSFTSIQLDQALPDIEKSSATLPSGESFLEPGTAALWYTMLEEALLDPATSGINNQTYSYGEGLTYLKNALNGYLANGSFSPDSLDYNSLTHVLTVTGPMASDIYTALESPYLYLPVYGANGLPVLDSSGHFVIETVPWMSANGSDSAEITALDVKSGLKPPLGNNGALIVGGTGYFDISAGSINLGNSEGILSVGDGGNATYKLLAPALEYSYLAPYIASDPGATINITTSTLAMPSSTIAALGGGDININCTGELPASLEDPLNNNGVGVSMDLGSPDLADFENEIMAANNLGLGIYTAGGGAVNVTALGTINIDTSRIATFSGGDINITSLTGDVNAGSGSTTPIPVWTFPVGDTLAEPYEAVYADGIVADTLAPEPNGAAVPGVATQPGNITVTTPEGSIYADVGGILQESLGESLLAGPYIVLEAGTPAGGDWSSTATPVYVGNVDMGNSGVIGGTVTVKGTGKISGVLISAQNANVTGQSVGGLTVLAEGTANVSAQGGSGGITIIGGQGVNASGIGSATLLGQNVSVNGAAAGSTLGSSAASTSTSTSAAGQTSDAAQQQIASDQTQDDENKKKKAKLHKVGRVTVILSAAEPPAKPLIGYR